jgi:hypothetical protein
METTGAVQGQGYLRQRRDDQAQGEEDQIVVGIVAMYYTCTTCSKHMGAILGELTKATEHPTFTSYQDNGKTVRTRGVS